MNATPEDVLSGLARWSLVPTRNDDTRSGLPTLGDKSFDHCLMDPPFEEAAHKKGRRVRKKKVEAKAFSYPPITEGERLFVAGEVHRLTKKWSLTFCQLEAIHLWRSAFEGAGATYVRTGIYWKDDAQPQLGGDRPGSGCEALVICWHGGKKLSWNGGGKCGRWTSKRDSVNGSTATLIDGMKPLRLMRQLVEDFTDEGDRIFDPYAGAGTTLIAANMLHRRSVGWEQDPATAEVARNRLLGEEARPLENQLRCFT
jgi:site-specific DNA-methyltransferase (adenine-specific)